MHGPAECAERLNNKRGQCANSDKTSFKTKQSQEYAKPIAIETPLTLLELARTRFCAAGGSPGKFESKPNWARNLFC